MKLIMLILPVLLVSGCAVVPVDGRGGKAGGDTALVCHKGKKTLELPQEAVQAHLNHGDSLGPC
jgi:hypothetical protein